MLNSAIVRIVDFCTRHRWAIIAAGTMLMIAAGIFDAARFSITTDIEALISQNLPWHQRQLEFTQAFPQRGISAVVRASTPENAEQSTNALARALSKNPDLYPRVGRPDSGDFFDRHGLLFESLSDVKASVEGLTTAEPIIASLAADPGLRGVMKALSFAADGVKSGRVRLNQLAWPLSLADKTLSDALAGKPATFSWQELLQGHPLQASQLRHFIEVQPQLDFAALQPGREATEGIRHADE